jgi:hypothetical protein
MTNSEVFKGEGSEADKARAILYKQSGDGLKDGKAEIEAGLKEAPQIVKVEELKRIDALFSGKDEGAMYEERREMIKKAIMVDGAYDGLMKLQRTIADKKERAAFAELPEEIKSKFKNVDDYVAKTIEDSEKRERRDVDDMINGACASVIDSIHRDDGFDRAQQYMKLMEDTFSKDGYKGKVFKTIEK